MPFYLEMSDFSEQAVSDLEFASMLHDIGKIGISQAILNKPDKLTEEEFHEIMKHPVMGAEIISEIPFLNECQVIIRQHHERVDGKGYPPALLAIKSIILPKYWLLWMHTTP